VRRGEICGLKWTDFDEATGRLNVNRSIEVTNGIVTEGEEKYKQYSDEYDKYMKVMFSSDE
jgi:integrase